LPVGEEAEVADADEASREQVQEKATQELIDWQCRDPLLVAVRGVSPAEADVAVGESNESAVGDADAMGVCTQIAQSMFRSSEGRLGIHHPVVTEQEPEPGSEAAWLSKRNESTVELERAFTERILQTSNELASEDTAEHLDGEEEGATRGDPVGVVRCKAACGDHTVDMGMMLQPLIPGMKHAEEADLGSEVSRIAGDLQ
jgi:hypothetical protein